MRQCSGCAYPNSYWRPRCGRCGAFQHTIPERIVIPVAVLLAALVALLIML